MPESDLQPKDQLYSEEEVKNPGYPGALLILGIPLLVLGALGVWRAVVTSIPSSAVFAAAIFIVPGTLLAIKSVRARRAQRRESWICRRCGYDRRGLASDAACPECGTIRTPTPKQVIPSVPRGI